MMENYAAVKNNGELPCVLTRKDLQDVCLSQKKARSRTAYKVSLLCRKGE